MGTLIHILYMVASVLFIIGIKRLSAVKTARSANALSALAMLLAMVAALLDIAHRGEIGWIWVGIGVVAGSGIGAYLDADRLQTPMLRASNGKGQYFRKASWDEALDFIARRMQSIEQKHGNDRLALLSHGSGGDFFQTLLQGFVVRVQAQTDDMHGLPVPCHGELDTRHQAETIHCSGSLSGLHNARGGVVVGQCEDVDTCISGMPNEIGGCQGAVRGGRMRM